MDLVYYIVEKHNGKFKPFVAYIVPDDDDAALYPISSGDVTDDLKSAQDFLIQNSKETDERYLIPIKSSEIGISWLSELKEVNKVNI